MQSRFARAGLVRPALFSALLLLFFEVFLFVAENVSDTAARVLLEPNEFAAQPDQRLGRRPRPRHPEHDERGWRNVEAMTRADIVAIGDSHTYGVGVGPAESWPARLSMEFGRSVYNLSFGGYGPAQWTELIPEALSLRPDVVVVGLYLGNDLFDAYYRVHVRGWRRDELCPQESARAMLDSLEAKSSLEEQVQSMRRHSGISRSFADRLPGFRTVALVRGANRVWRSRRAADTDKAWSLSLDEAKEDPNLRAVTCHQIRTVLRVPYRRLALDLGDGRIAEGLRLTQSSIREMNRELAQDGTRLVVLVIPTKETVLAESGCLSDEGGPVETWRELAILERRAAAALIETCLQERVTAVDLFPTYVDAVMSGEVLYRPSKDGHPTPAGHRTIAERVVMELSKISELDPRD